MNGRLALDTTKKLLLNNIPLVLVYMVFITVINLDGNEYIKLQPYVLAAFHLITILLFALCVATITISMYKTFVVDLLMGKSYKYYSLPYKKSEIIFSKAVPAILIESLMVTLLFRVEDYQDLIMLLVDIKQNTDYYRSEWLKEWASHSIISFVTVLMIVVTIGFLILLAFVISRSFDPSKTVRNLLIAIIVEALVNCVLYIVIENISFVYSDKYTNAVQEAVQASPILTSKELYSSVGLLAYYDHIFAAVCILIMTVEIVCLIIASKKLADKRLNVL